MIAAIFAEGSQTTANTSENLSASDYFQGTFQPVASLADDLPEYVSTELHIITDSHGYLRGSTSLNEMAKHDVDASRAKERFSVAIVTAAARADVIIILLSASTFRETVGRNWEDILSTAQEGTIWCFGASRGVLQSVGLSDLESTVDDVIVYKRVGVAPIGQETRSQLLERVREAGR